MKKVTKQILIVLTLALTLGVIGRLHINANKSLALIDPPNEIQSFVIDPPNE